MCTVTWYHQDCGYHLFFNRDEQRDRAVARAPRIHQQEGPAFVAPIDAEAGGTWLAASAGGLTVCLLNLTLGEPNDQPASLPFHSRGMLVLEAMRVGAVRDLPSVIQGQTLSKFRPFVLIGIEPGQPAATFRWDGSSLEATADPRDHAMVSTSSRKPKEVAAGRAQRFEQFRNAHPQDGPEAYRRFHADHSPEAGPFSICMHREDAETVSFSHVTVDRDATYFRYLAHSPCRANAGDEIVLHVPRS
jgi:hypothetical protein